MSFLTEIAVAARELWTWVRAHAWVLFLCTVAAYAHQHYSEHGPPAHLLILPGLAVSMFFAFPLWAAIVHDVSATTDPPLPTRRHDPLALGLASLGAAVALAPALVWGYAPAATKTALKDDPRMLVVGAGLGAALVLAAALRGKVDLGRWGLGFGDVRWWSRPVGFLLVLVFVGIPLVAWMFPEFVAFYPRYKPARTALLPLIEYELAMGVYMFCWEFLFRGYMLFGLARVVGPFAAIVIQCWPFFLLHADKPEPELASSWFGGLLVGWLCWRARSMWPSFLLHWVMYATMEVTAFALRNL
ncbi:MAG: CPBP family intramembrane glutamic endopeptidase [Myxococcota bacterium]